MVVETGWSRFWPDAGAYFALDADGAMHFPGIGVAAMLAIQPGVVDWGEQPTPAVAAAIPPACAAIHDLIRDWRHVA